MKTNDAIEASKRRATAWGDFLVTTFRKLGITDNGLTDYAVLKIRERMARWLLPHGFMEEWRKKIMGVLGV